MGFVSEFKEFAIKGNAIDLAVGIVIGAAFGKITTSLVNDVIMPPLSLLLGRVDLANRFVDLSGKGFATLAEAKAAAAPTLNYGIFISIILEFLIIALAVFLVVKTINRLRALRKAEEKKEEKAEKK